MSYALLPLDDSKIINFTFKFYTIRCYIGDPYNEYLLINLKTKYFEHTSSVGNNFFLMKIFSSPCIHS